jgi:hypothetical protein
MAFQKHYSAAAEKYDEMYAYRAQFADEFAARIVEVCIQFPFLFLSTTPRDSIPYQNGQFHVFLIGSKIHCKSDSLV